VPFEIGVVDIDDAPEIPGSTTAGTGDLSGIGAKVASVAP
jgi:hypothetical protein